MVVELNPTEPLFFLSSLLPVGWLVSALHPISVSTHTESVCDCITIVEWGIMISNIVLA